MLLYYCKSFIQSPSLSLVLAFLPHKYFSRSNDRSNDRDNFFTVVHGTAYSSKHKAGLCTWRKRLIAEMSNLFWRNCGLVGLVESSDSDYQSRVLAARQLVLGAHKVFLKCVSQSEMS